MHCVRSGNRDRVKETVTGLCSAYINYIYFLFIIYTFIHLTCVFYMAYSDSLFGGGVCAVCIIVVMYI